MTITIGRNIASLQAQRQLSRATSELSTTFERLSSGLRINSASDDPAGLALAMRLNADSRIANVAIRNANDGISAVQLGDQALGEIQNVLMRMAELAQQSANGIFSVQQRSPIQAEFAALASEIERIALSTKFNSISLLSGGQSIILQVGFDSFSTSRLAVQGVEGTLSSLLLAGSGSSQMIYSVIGNSVLESQNAARTALAAVQAAIEAVDVRRGQLGAAESRLQVAVSNLSAARVEFDAAKSRIEDVDVAQEVARLISQQIRQQAATAILAQANIQPNIALRLLGGGS